MSFYIAITDILMFVTLIGAAISGIAGFTRVAWWFGLFASIDLSVFAFLVLQDQETLIYLARVAALVFQPEAAAVLIVGNLMLAIPFGLGVAISLLFTGIKQQVQKRSSQRLLPAEATPELRASADAKRYRRPANWREGF